MSELDRAFVAGFQSHVDEHETSEDCADGASRKLARVDDDFGYEIAREQEQSPHETRGGKDEAVVLPYDGSDKMRDGHAYEGDDACRGYGDG